MVFPKVITSITPPATPGSTARVTNGGERPRRGGTRTLVVVISFLLALFYCLLPSGPAHAVTLFKGGSCTLVTQANGVRLDFCTNLTGKTVDDIHVTFTHAGLPPVLVDYGQSVACTLFGIGNCFGPAVKPNKNWNGIGGGVGAVSNVTLWGPADLGGKDINFDNVKASGYWTIGGKAVPEPATWALMIVGLGLVGAALRSRRQRVAAVIA